MEKTRREARAKRAYYIYTLGCQMNHSDSERFKTIIEGSGYYPTNVWQKADLLIFNTCSVRQKAEDRVIGMGPQIQKLKKQNTNLKVVLTGCMARRVWNDTASDWLPQQEKQKTREIELKKTMPWVDIVIETREFGKLPERLGIMLNKTSEEILRTTGGFAHYLSYKPKLQSRFQAFVPISTGCDHFCTYCIVPFARGNEVCRSAQSIIEEVFYLVKSDYRDISLLGQTVNRWVNPKYDLEIKKGQIACTKIPQLNKKPLNLEQLKQWGDFFELMDKNYMKQYDSDSFNPHYNNFIQKVGEPKDFLQLLQVLDQINGVWWGTWISSHPNYMTEELIKFVGDSSKSLFSTNPKGGHQRPYLHFALQSGSNTVLRRMNRRYTYEEFKSIVDMMRKYIPGIAITTDIIVGFPGESDEDFQKTTEAIKQCRFDTAFISEFSKREGTAAGLIRDDVSFRTKATRKKTLNDDHLKVVALKNNKNMVGDVQKVLVDGVDRKGNLMGRTKNNKEIRIINSSDKKLTGEFIDVEVTDCSAWALEGVIKN